MAVVVYVPSRLGEGYFTDLPAPTAADDAKAITYDHGTGAFVYAAAGGGTPGGSDTQVQYNSSGSFAGGAGMTYDAANDRLTVTGGLVAPSMRPASDSTTALQLQNAAGTAFVTVDTTNQRVGIGVTPTARLDVLSSVYPVVRGERTTGTTNIAVAVANFVCTTSNDMTDGHGVEFALSIQDNANVENAIATFGAIRDGADNSGAIVFYPRLFGVKTERMRISSLGYVGIFNASPTALLDLAASTTTRASLRIRSGTAPTTPNAGDVWDDGALVAYNTDATTNAIVNSLKLRRGSSGTPATGFGLGIAARLESSTTEDRDAGRLTYEWVTATDASRASRGKLTAFYTTTEQEAMRWDGDTGGLKLGFYGTAAVAQQVLATGAGASVDDVIQALQNLGLVKQS